MSLLSEYVGNWRQLLRGDRSCVMHRLYAGLRFYPVWRYSLTSGKNALDHQVPWITFEARRFVRSLLTPGAFVFEYGAGGSTFFYSKRVKWVVSVEHDVDWFNRVKAALVERRVNNCDCRLVPPEPMIQPDWSPHAPEAYCSSNEAYRTYQFRRYAASIDSFPDEFFEFVSIDGRARPSCIYHARRKVKAGGYLMLDNSERPHYRKAKELLSDWEKYEFYGPGPHNHYFWETTIWKKVRT